MSRGAARKNYDALLEQARAAQARGDSSKALKLLDRATASKPKPTGGRPKDSKRGLAKLRAIAADYRARYPKVSPGMQLIYAARRVPKNEWPHRLQNMEWIDAHFAGYAASLLKLRPHSKK